MTRRNLLGTVVLVILLVIVGRLVYGRAYRVLFTARPATLAAPYTTEEAWVVEEIVRDVTEMGRRAADVAPEIARSAEAGTYAVSGAGLATPVRIDLRTALWSPEAFAPLAAAVVGQPGPAAMRPLDAHAGLLDLTALTLLDANTTVSKALQADLRDASAHDAAALTVAAFALREPLGRQADTRWAMNRITAHLALARALSADPASVDGRLADTVLLILTGKQVRAMAALDALDADVATEATAAWTRALRLRIAEDWRTLPEPRQATRLEQREYFRARRLTIRTVSGAAEVDALGRPMDVDWYRLVNGWLAGVEDAGLVTEALAWERAELDDVHMRLQGRALVAEEAAALNALATRAMGPGGPQVLPWGAWAEFGQRRLAEVITRYDGYLRRVMGASDDADAAKRKMHAQLGELWIFPPSTLWWTRGQKGLEGDDTYVREAIDIGITQPQRLTATAWSFLEFASRYASVTKLMAPARAWFVPADARSGYESAVRLEASDLAPVQDDERLLADAPYDFRLAQHYLVKRHGKTLPFDAVLARAGERMHYDTRAITLALESAGGDDRSVDLLSSACRFSVGYCRTLGYELARRGRAAEAAAAYEQALLDDQVDAVSRANWSGWLVDYYRAQGRTGPALELAESAASTGASAGIVAAARLYERLGRFADAEAAFQRNAGSYDAPGELIAFYHRAVAVRKDGAYAGALHQALERVFPAGLTEGTGPDGTPTSGVFIEHDSAPARAAGLQAGDVIVAVDGWRVENVAQYRAVRAFPLEGGFTLTTARGGARTTVTIADRAFTPDFRIAEYSPRGWIEK